MKTSPAPVLLLDTHVWFGFVNGDLKADFFEADRQIEAYSRRNAVYVAAISMWEIAMLESKGRIQLPVDCSTWLKRALDAPGIELEGLSLEIAVASTRLSDGGPRDPSDRMIIASAMSLGAVLATRDREIISYCEKHALPFLTF